MTVYLKKSAAKCLSRISEPYKGQIEAALANLKKEPPEGDIKPMTGQPGNFRLKIGWFRVLFRIENNCIVVFIITSRGQAYKKKNRGKK
jgi:mRNA interferase RelE/StbE